LGVLAVQYNIRIGFVSASARLSDGL